MNNKGQITVFLSLLVVAMLLLGLSVIEIVRVSMGRAKAAEAAAGAVYDVKAAYHKELFGEYHLLAVDRELGGQGDGKLPQLAQEYLEYTICSDGDMQVELTELSGERSLLDGDCEGMRRQITDYMELYEAAQGLDRLLSLADAKESAGLESAEAIERGKQDEAGDNDLWIGKDPRSVMKSLTSGGLIDTLTPDGETPSKEVFDTDGLPSEGENRDEDIWEDFEFDDLDELESHLWEKDPDSSDTLKDNFYGICYAMEFFNKYTSSDRDRPLDCEVEYMICGKDNDYDNLKGVVYRIIAHRLPVNLAYLLTDSSRVAEVEAIAAVLALIPGVTYSAVKYLLLGCWAYAETIADIRVLLDGNKVQLIKSSASWNTDIYNLAGLTRLGTDGYEGVDAIGYEEFLAVLLAEHAGDMYIRMADLIQMKLSLYEDTFVMENMLCEFSLDVVLQQAPMYKNFIETEGKGVGINEDLYRHEYSMSVSY